MLLRRLPKGASRRYSAVAAAKITAVPRFETHHVPPPVLPLQYKQIQRMEELQRQPLTVLPTPLPEGLPQNEYYFPSSKKQQSLAVIAACLRDLYDVPRAEEIFNRLREDAESGASVMTIDTYNALLLAYAQLQAEGTPLVEPVRAQWAEKLWNLWQVLVSESDRVALNATSMAIAFLAHVRAPHDEYQPSTSELLEIFLDKKLAVTDILGSPVLSSDADHEAVRQLIRQAAEEGQRSDVLELLRSHDQLVPTRSPATWRTNITVPEAQPVQVTQANTDGTVTSTLPYNLQSLRTNLETVQSSPEAAVWARQLDLETSAYDTTIERLQHEMEKLEEIEMGAASKLKHPSLQQWMYQWLQVTEVKLENDIKALATREKSVKPSTSNPLDAPLTPFLRLLNTSKLAMITILELMRLHGTGGVSEGMKTSRALVSVGRAIEAECLAVWSKKRSVKLDDVAGAPRTLKTKKVPVKLSKATPGVNKSAAAPKEAEPSTEAAVETESPIVTNMESSMPEWTQIVRVRVGSFLVNAVMESATIKRNGVDENGEQHSEDQPAFTHSYEYVRGKKLGVIKLNPVVGEKMARDSVKETLHPRHLPMLVKPRPWEDYDKGGYLKLHSTVMRIKDSLEQLSYLRHASAAGHIDFVYECLDALGETPWRINNKILNVVLEVWNEGKNIAGIPPVQLEVEEPPPPADDDPRARATYLFKMKSILTDKRNNHGERCHVNYKLEVARAFVNDEFYFPHNVDFRGRAYPIPPHLNHIGDDLSRGLLLFAEHRPLGERGLRWLKIHIANLYGFDKASFDERAQFADDRLEEIKDSAENPLTGKKWWLGADDPWQCLATCMELTEALKLPNPYLYESNLPVHQDGTCNGLQHYAALGGDVTGAQHVNLEHGLRPADVYSHVARMVDVIVNKDAEAGLPEALLVQGKIARKVVKQTVMTTVYGVTFIGARDQIEKQLRDIVGVSREESWPVAAYLAKQVLGAIGDLFSGASSIQHWLSISARLIAKSIPEDRMEAVQDASPREAARERMTSVIWTTALGLPIVQPYRKAKKKQILTSLQSVFISDPNLPTQVDPVKQSAAFPPNFVHSLDATHMMLTALECRAASITFASVHDSYWTHASTVDDMSAIIRDTFIALHNSNILQKLREEFLDRYEGYRVPLSTLTDRELCYILRSLVDPSRDPESPPEPALLSLIVALVKRSASRYAKEEVTKQALMAAEELLSSAQLEAGKESVDNAVEMVPDEEPEAAVEDMIEEFIEGSEEKPTKRKSSIKRGRVVAGKLDRDLQYLLLTDILPILPEKGDFDVHRIKDSEYFFS
ncbi:DNA-directed RNA polymerase [Rhizoctonia solani AG-3 Rhs1AP]|uniref:DNA-directed RNA polymerase n=1 Tax=Rhizoctonia solani AG-3 Rhs1AP TaxID=1086054 RepID=X8JGQ9_9AGAM|nr:DNA-directed RNA polymerase [Rhizoctonia solani AG-3 Rhs1AP]